MFLENYKIHYPLQSLLTPITLASVGLLIEDPSMSSLSHPESDGLPPTLKCRDVNSCRGNTHGSNSMVVNNLFKRVLKIRMLGINVLSSKNVFIHIF